MTGNPAYEAIARASRASSPADAPATPRERLELAHQALTSLLTTMRDYSREATKAASQERELVTMPRELATANHSRALEIEDEIQQCQRTASRIGRLLGVES